MTTNPTQVKAADLAVGTWISTGDGPAEVLLVQPFTDADGPGVYLTYRQVGGAINSYAAEPDQLFEIVTATQLAYLKADAERTQQIADLRSLADWLEDNSWLPIPELDVNRHLYGPDGYRTVVEMAERLGAKLDKHLDDRTKFTFRKGPLSYSLLAWHDGGRPAEPEPAVCLGRDMDCGRPLPCPDHPEPAADPFGLNYTRADDQADDPTPVSPARVPMHNGGMTEGGLVDETPADPVHMDYASGESMCGLAATTPHKASLGWSHVTCKSCISEADES